MQRRKFLKLGLAGLGAAALRPLSLLGLPADASAEGFCFMMGDHWSYIGIGWQLVDSSTVRTYSHVLRTQRVQISPRGNGRDCESLDHFAHGNLSGLLDQVQDFAAALLRQQTSVLASGHCEIDLRQNL